MKLDYFVEVVSLHMMVSFINPVKTTKTECHGSDGTLSTITRIPFKTWIDNVINSNYCFRSNEILGCINENSIDVYTLREVDKILIVRRCGDDDLKKIRLEDVVTLQRLGEFYIERCEGYFDTSDFKIEIDEVLSTYEQIDYDVLSLMMEDLVSLIYSEKV